MPRPASALAIFLAARQDYLALVQAYRQGRLSAASYHAGCQEYYEACRAADAAGVEV